MERLNKLQKGALIYILTSNRHFPLKILFSCLLKYYFTLQLLQANKDIRVTGAKAAAAAIQGEKFMPQMYINNNYDGSDDEKMLLDFTPKKILNINPLSGRQHGNSDDFTSPTNLILTNTPLNTREHAVDDDFTSTFI